MDPNPEFYPNYRDLQFKVFTVPKGTAKAAMESVAVVYSVCVLHTCLYNHLLLHNNLYQVREAAKKSFFSGPAFKKKVLF